MGTLNRQINLFIDSGLPGGAACLLEGRTDSRPNQVPNWMQGDKFTLNVFFRCRAESEATTSVELAAGFGLVLCGKARADLASGNVLFLSDTWSRVVAGDDVCYATTVDLGTDNISELFNKADSGDSIEVAVDLEYQGPGNVDRSTFRFMIMLCRQGYQGSEVSPTPSQTYRIASPGGIVYQLSVTDDGRLQLERV